MTTASAPSPTPIADALLLTVPEAATALRLSESSVYRLIRSGQLRTVRIAGVRRVPRKAAEALVETLVREAERSETNIRALLARQR